MCVVASVHCDGGTRLVVSVGEPDGTLLRAIETNSPVALLCQDLVAGSITTSRAGHVPWPAILIDLGAVESRPAVTQASRSERAALAERQQASQVPVSGTSVLNISGLTIYYGETRAVHDLSLQVMRGEIFGLLGPNGAGKTSTLSAIEGLLKPRSGAVSLDGIDVLRQPLEAKARMGVQLQETNFQANPTLRQIVRLFAGLCGSPMSEGESRRRSASDGSSGTRDDHG